jgi:hypothetical protein
MTRLFSIAMMAFVLLTGCTETADVQEPTTSAVTFANYDVFGNEFDQDKNIPVQQMAANPADYLGQSVNVSGTITEVCQGRGCWMTLQVSDAQLVRIVMPRDEDNNYLFTLDKGMSGRRALVRGMLDESTLFEFEAPMHQSDEAENHHEGDDHSDEEMATGLELHITATGVIVEKTETVEETSAETTD